MSSLKRGLFPEGYVCIGCGAELRDDFRRLSLCEDCLKKLPFRTHKACEKCGDYIDDGRLCKSCSVSEPFYEKAIAPYDYSGVVKKTAIIYKDGGAEYLYKYIALHLADFYAATDLRPDFLTYVPSDKKAIARRGFEHNKPVAEVFSELVNLPLINPLERIKITVPQKKKNREERMKNISGAFGIKKDFGLSKIEKKSILLLDDVMTTGATVNECAKVLTENGAAKVYVLALARR